jgi:hypothetical protein
VTLNENASEESGWISKEATGSGERNELTAFGLSVADDAGLAYEQVDFDVRPRCAWHVVERDGCTPSSCRTCAIVLDRISHTQNVGMHHAAAGPVHVAGPSCGACLPDPLAALVPRIAAILRGRTYSLRWETIVLRFYRRKADCEAELRAAPAN